MVRAVHDAAVALGAQCHDTCAFGDLSGGGALDQVKGYTQVMARARVLSFMHFSAN